MGDSGGGQDPAKPRGRLGSLTADNDSAEGRLGNLRMGTPSVAPTAAAGGEGGAAAAAAATEAAFTTGGVRKTKFQPKVPTRRKKAAGEGGQGDGPREAQLPDQIMQLISQSTADLAVDRRKGRRRQPDAPKPASQSSATRVMFGAGVTKEPPGKSGGGGGGGSGGAAAGGASSSGRGGTSAPAVGSVQVSSAARVVTDRMRTENQAVKFEGYEGGEGMEEEEDGAAVLDYSKYYPTLLPMRKPEDEQRVGLDGDDPPPRSGPPEGMGGDLVDDTRTAAEVVSAACVKEPEDELEDDLSEDPWSQNLLLLQLPWCLPHVRPPQPRVPGEEEDAGLAPMAEEEDDADKPPAPAQGSLLEELPPGRVGKLKVYESGAVKLHLGDMVMDVQAGAPCTFSQHVAVVNVSAAERAAQQAGGAAQQADARGHFIMLGDVAGRLVVSPDLDQLLGGMP